MVLRTARLHHLMAYLEGGVPCITLLDCSWLAAPSDEAGPTLGLA